METYASKIKFIEGWNLYLRPLLKSDHGQLLSWINDPELRSTLSHYLPINEKFEMDWIENKTISEKDVALAIVLKENNTLIGATGIHRIDYKDRTAIGGTSLSNKKFQENGYGTEAKMLMLHYAFYSLNLRKIVTEVFETNVRSLALQKRCGAQLEGVLKKQVYKNGQYLDLHSFGLFKEDFEKVWEKYKEKFV